jgi:hypothetical protein
MATVPARAQRGRDERSTRLYNIAMSYNSQRGYNLDRDHDGDRLREAMKLRSSLYRSARILGDVEAVASGNPEADHAAREEQTARPCARPRRQQRRRLLPLVRHRA